MWLLTNDDGIDAAGLEALRCCVPANTPTLVVAPARPCSECGHSVTTGRPLQIQQRGPLAFAVDGTPADCVRVALHVLAPQLQTPLTAVLSGINHGANLGVDIYLSGTVAAAREASLHGIPAIALSQYRHPDATLDWSTAPAWITHHLGAFLSHRSTTRGFWNVNLPALPNTSPPSLVYTLVDSLPLPLRFVREGDSVSYQGDYHSRPRSAGSDVEACFSGHISASFVPLENDSPR